MRLSRSVGGEVADVSHVLSSKTGSAEIGDQWVTVASLNSQAANLQTGR